MAIPPEVWHVATRMLLQHGAVAEHLVLDRMRELCQRSDLAAFAGFAKILAAINELRRTERQDEERLN